MRNIILFFVQKHKKSLAAISANLAIFLALLVIIFGRAVFAINHLYIGIEGDSSFYMWITKWFSQPFSHTDIFHVGNAYFPMGIDVSAGWEGSILYYYGGFLNSIFSESAAYNLLILTPLALNWISVYYVFNKLSKRIFLSGLFSTLFCTSSFFIARSLGHPSYLYLFHIPLLFYFLQYEWLKNLNFKRALLLIAVYILISITSWYYFIFALVITLAYLASFAVQNGRADLKIYGKIAAAYAAMFVLVIAFNFPMFKAFLFGSPYYFPYPFKMNNEAPNQANSMHLIEYFKPSTLNALYSGHPAWQVGSVEKILFPGLAYYLLLAVSLILIFIKKDSKGKYVIIALIGVLFVVFSLGYNSPLPLYKLLNSLPFASSLHAPSRFGIVAVLAGWVFITMASRNLKNKSLTALFLILIAVQLYETAQFHVPFQNFDNLKILEKLDSADKTPVLELPVRTDKSETLLIPTLSGRSIFSGYPQHTTYSPQLNYFAMNNVLGDLGTENNDSSDVLPKLTAEESIAYLKWKFGVKDVVLNEQLPLSLKASELLKYAELSAKNSSYAIYGLNKIPQINNGDSVKIVTGKGIGQLINGKRTIAEKGEIDILNFSDQPQKFSLHFVAAEVTPDTNYSVDGHSLKNDVAIVARPGLGTLEISADKKCTVSGADCITGTISKISIIESN